MKLTHLQNSTQLIRLDEITVLTDPWLTDGEYYVSWYYYPPFGNANLESLKHFAFDLNRKGIPKAQFV